MLYKTFITTTLCLLIMACSSSSSSNKSTMDSSDTSTEDMQPMNDVRFSELVREVLSKSDDSADPVDINTTTIEFDHDESNFDDLF